MINLGLYKATDIPFFKEFSLDLAYKGVTVIRGRNLNATDMAGRNNGSGKSLLLSGIAEIIVSSSPAIERNEVFARRSLFPAPSSQILLEVNKQFISKGRFGLVPVSYGIQNSKGGLEKVKREVAEQFIEELIGYNEDSFYTLVYLDGGRDFPLILGTAVQRIQFLSNLFDDLDVYELLYDHFNQKVRGYSEKVKTLTILEEELSELESEAPDIVEVPTKYDIEQAGKKLKQARLKASKIRKELTSAEMANTWTTIMLRMEEGCKALGGLEVDAIQERFRKEERLKRANDEYTKVKNSLARLKTRLADINKEIDRLEDSDTDDSRYDLIDGASGHQEKYLEISKSIGSVMNANLKVLGLPFRVKNPTSCSEVPNLLTILEFILMCLLPGENIISKQTAKSPLAIASKIPNTDMLKRVSELGVVRKQLESFLKARIILSDTHESLSKKEIAKIKKARANKIELEDLTDESMLVKEEVESYQKRLSEMKLSKLLSNEDYKILESLYKDSITLESLQLEAPSSISEADLKDLRKRQEVAEERVAELAYDYEQKVNKAKFYEQHQAPIARLSKKIESLTKYREALPVVEGLKKAYSNKGVRVLLLKRLTDELSNRMNEYAHLTFPEPMSFRFEITEKSCEILAVRNPGTKHCIISDIRTLSRGERKSFCLLLLYALLPILPKHKRFNTVFLDEMTSNMDAPTKHKIFRDFIPALREIVPHVVLADTGTLDVDDAREYVVVKEGNVSQLVEEVH